jgi:transcriptional regulator with XRE-family HTH domain
MGVDRSYVSGLELGQRNPTVVTLWHAAQALGIEVHRCTRQNPNNDSFEPCVDGSGLSRIVAAAGLVEAAMCPAFECGSHGRWP